MSRFEVLLKYGDPGKSKNNSQTVVVEADSESVAMRLAVNKLKNSNAAYRDKEIEPAKVKKL